VTEFTKWRSLVDGEEIIAIPDGVLLPESDDLDNFDGDVEDYDINDDSPVIYTEQNNLSLKQSDEGEVSIESTSGLNRYPERGEKFAYYFQGTSGDPDAVFKFGLQDSSNFYSVMLRLGSDSLRIRKDGDNEDIESVSVSFDTWYDIEVEWESNGDITVRLFDVDQSGNRESEIGSVSTTDSEYESGGIGFESISDTGLARYDYVRVTDELD